jgi:FkbM family methyltransferase
LLRRWFLAERLISVSVGNGVHIRLPASGELAYAFVVDGGFENAEREFVQSFLRSGDIFFDVGANAGLYTVLGAISVGNRGRVHAFEPDPRGCNLLRKNIELNKLCNVILKPVAVSNRDGRVKFASCTDSAYSSMRENKYHQTRGSLEWIEVDSITLDAYVEQQHLERVDFVKIDVEGAELHALQGAEMLLNERPAPVLMIEFCDVTTAGFGYKAVQLGEYLEGYGYQLYEYDAKQHRLLKHQRQVGYDWPTLIATKDPADINARLADLETAGE